jgi:hypothetical protein
MWMEQPNHAPMPPGIRKKNGKCATDVPGSCRANSLQQFKVQLKSCGAPGRVTDFSRGTFVIKTQADLPLNFRIKSRKQYFRLRYTRSYLVKFSETAPITIAPSSRTFASRTARFDSSGVSSASDSSDLSFFTQDSQTDSLFLPPEF